MALPSGREQVSPRAPRCRHGAVGAACPAAGARALCERIACVGPVRGQPALEAIYASVLDGGAEQHAAGNADDGELTGIQVRVLLCFFSLTV